MKNLEKEREFLQLKKKIADDFTAKRKQKMDEVNMIQPRAIQIQTVKAKTDSHKLKTISRRDVCTQELLKRLRLEIAEDLGK